MHGGRGQQGLPIQGRMSSEEILEWALDPESKLGQIWDFLWNFPTPSSLLSFLHIQSLLMTFISSPSDLLPHLIFSQL